MTSDDTINKILNAARWAPSGDNTQPWRFQILGAHRLRVRASDTRDWCVYDLEGRASQLAVGTLLESLVIAASAEGLDTRIDLLPDCPETAPLIDVTFVEGASLAPSPLRDMLERRVTQRRPLARTALQEGHRRALEASVGTGFRVVWLAGSKARRQMAALLFRNAGIRLSIREAFEVHRRIIAWDAQFSEDRIPDRALGLDTLGLKTMRWAMGSWERVRFLNQYLGGTLLPRLMMDWLPGLRCAAHFFIVADRAPEDLAGYLDAGRAVQRFWLTATAQGVQFQPEMTPIIFSGYVRRDIPFTASEPARRQAADLRRSLILLIGERNLDQAVFAGRVGYGPTPTARSVRLPLDRLTIP